MRRYSITATAHHFTAWSLPAHKGRIKELSGFPLQTAAWKPLTLESTEEWKGVYDGALLTMRYVTDAPLPDDWEQYMAAIQNTTVEYDRYDPRTGERRKLAERPYYEKEHVR